MEQQARYGREPLLKVWQHKYFVYGLIALLCYEIAEISINSYFINYVTGMGWMDDRTASMVLTAALAFFMVGRFGGSLVMRKVPAETMLFLCGGGCVACVMLVLMNFGRLSLIGLIGVFLFEAVMFPTIFSLAVRDLGSLTKSASSILMMTPVGGCGFLLVGVIADATDMVVPFIIPLLCYVIVGLYGFGLMVSQARKARDSRIKDLELRIKNLESRVDKL